MTTGDPRVPAALRGQPEPAAAGRDPLRWCVATTVSLLTWAIGPAALVAFSAIALVAYGRAFVAGRRTSRCLLHDVRLVLVYLALTASVGVAAAVRGW